jgi:hypothetical protein
MRWGLVRGSGCGAGTAGGTGGVVSSAGVRGWPVQSRGGDGRRGQRPVSNVGTACAVWASSGYAVLVGAARRAGRVWAGRTDGARFSGRMRLAIPPD